MKKIFTLAAFAAMTLVANAQAEKWSATKATTNEEGATVYVAIDDYAVLGEEGEASIVKIECEHFTGEHVSGPVDKYEDGELKEDGTLNYIISNSWDGPKTQALSADGSVAPLVYMQGKGNPVNLSLVKFELKNEEEPELGYRANWDDSYYNPDGSTGGPMNGTYASVTPKIDGTFKVGVWVNKGNRDLYVCDNIDYKAKAFGTDVKVSGYIQATTWGEEDTDDSNILGYMKFQDEIPTKGTEGADAFIIAAGNRPVWAWLTFEAKKDVTYYIFNKNTQLGLMDVEFTPGEDTSISSVEAPAASAAAFNLAGQKVNDNFKGVVVKNGKKVVVK